MKQINFFENEYYMLSNWSAHNVFFNGVLYKTADHAYHCCKFAKDTVELLLIHSQIEQATSPMNAKDIAKSFEYLRIKNWEEIKVVSMYQINKAKVLQHKDVFEAIKKSGELELIEDSPYDSFWGTGKDGKGENMLGKIWMQIRQELISKSVA
jgi:ribA/ribD-fused uncharacterized protein